MLVKVNTEDGIIDFVRLYKFPLQQTCNYRDLPCDHHAGDPNSSRATLTSQSSRGSVKSSDARNQLDETDSFARGKENRSLFADRGSRPDRVVTEDRAHEINSSFQRKKPGTAMLVTEQPLVFGSTAHLYDNQDGRESLETEDPADKYLFRNDSTLSANVDQFRQLDRQFPNGFPDFNGQFRTSGGDSALNGKFKTNGADFFVKNFVKRNNGHFDNLGGFDAGYSSEKSPEEEEPPSCFDIETVPSSRDQTESPVHEEQTTGISDQVVEEKSLIQQLVEDGVQLTTATVMNVYPFINEGTLFDVTLEKNSRGLGLSLCGGRESKGPHAGLLRVKKLYPQMPAWLCGQLRVGDIILEANCTVMTGLTSHEALEVLRTTRTSGVHLLLCRPPSGGLLGDDDVLASPTAPTRPLEVVSTSLLGEQGAYSDHLMPPSPHSMCGEFEVTLAKVKGSLGFTLRKRDNSVLGHTIRTLVRDPALSDGRIKPGDKILSVNNQDLCGLSHEEAIAFLRTTPDVVTIRLYRDVTQTPVSPLSPTEPDPSPLNPKPLRQEARDMLSDLRKRASPHSASPGLDTSHSPSPGNPRRRRLQKSSTSDVTKASIVERFDMLLEGTEEASQNPQVCPALAGDRDLTNRDSCASTLSANSTIISRHASSASTETNSDASETLRRTRPNFLDLENRQSCTRKTQFSPPHEIEDSFPSPSDDDVNYEEYLDSIGSVDSAPACNNAQSVSPSFAYSQPGYQSVNFGASNYQDHGRITGTSSDFTLSSHLKNTSSKVCQKSGLMKWKGTYMGQDESDQDADEEENAADCGLAKSRRKKVVTIELHRGWNSRLGFSLKADGEATRVVAVYAGCVAAKDGRLKVGDEIISVNDEDVTQWSTCDVIDRLRKTHGKIVLKVLQQPF
ncbi:tyrosine-protein phosphatase non-receptor type 13 isoform X3 [Hyalella azteca]|uniref:Tyrosine-protein phosphatase non-receptor type 13 isoform X3 n=1 Tax=Hyalella azteca TaxID=294128 RepID=A0A979FT65_HYAAZ|nr:tyrosine-protein phosphatase non-receptor type 13 isoform X3 [Hyalella azteca]